MNNYVQRRHPDSEQRLEMLVRQDWEAIPQHVIQGYIRNIHNICNQIVENDSWDSRG